MKTIQITIQQKLLTQMDKALKGRRRQRSAFIRKSITAELNRLRVQRLEEQHRLGYLRHPVTKEEFDIDSEVQVWPKDWEDDSIGDKWGDK